MDLRQVQRFCGDFIRIKKLKILIAIGWIHRRWPDVVGRNGFIDGIRALKAPFRPSIGDL
jgi:hypothetical protein